MTLRDDVEYQPSLTNEIAEQWVRRDDVFRDRITAATREIDHRLKVNPGEHGVDLHGDRFHREARFAGPGGGVRVVSDIYPPRRLVEVVGITLIS